MICRLVGGASGSPVGRGPNAARAVRLERLRRVLWRCPSPGAARLQLRVVSLTLGLSLAVILVLGFVLTSQVTDRILDVKVRAADRGDRPRPQPPSAASSAARRPARSTAACSWPATRSSTARPTPAPASPAPSMPCWWCPATGRAPRPPAGPVGPGAQYVARLRQGRTGQLPVRDGSHRRLHRARPYRRQPHRRRRSRISSCT